MSTQNQKKITKFLENLTPNSVCLASWLETLDISRDLQKRYVKSGWLESIGPGAYKRPHEAIRWQGGLHALQYQANLPIHVGGLTALSLQGLAHYIKMTNEPIFIYTQPSINVPKWFRAYSWQNPLDINKTSFLPPAMAIIEHEEKSFSIKLSSPERAILECLYVAPDKIDLTECFHLMEGLVNLQPEYIQRLLENCRSVKAKRLFMYLAQKCNHMWLDFIDRSKVDLGKGHRHLVKSGTYVPAYEITVSQELVNL